MRWATAALRLLPLALTLPLSLAGQGLHEDLNQALELMHKGQYQRAEERLLRIDPPNAHALRLLLELKDRRGQKEEFAQVARQLLVMYASAELDSPDEIAQVAYAAWQLEDFERANQIYQELDGKGGASRSMYVDWGELFTQKYSEDTLATLNDAQSVETNPDYWERWGLDSAAVASARAKKVLLQPGAGEALEQALGLNSENLEAINLSALIAIEKLDWEEAESWLEKGRKINKQYLPFLETQAAYHYFQDQEELYQKAVQKVLEINPVDADLYELLGDLSLGKRRLDESIQFYRDALRLDPRQFSAMASLGLNLLRMGDEEEGRRVLETAFANDSYNVWAFNVLTLIDTFEDYERSETPNFLIKLHKKEARIVGPYVRELLERSMTTLQAKYGYQVGRKTHFEMYPDHGDFAVRALGLPGLGALGATFGQVVAMDSPSGRPRGEFHWGSTLWHEVTHVLTLAMSEERVPRWLTEGISMMEERQAGNGWGDGINPGFVQAYKEGKLLPVQDLSSGFERPTFPQQVELSYLQAKWVCEYLVERFGFDQVTRMVKAYAEGLSTEEIFLKVLGISVADFDAEFSEVMAETLTPMIAQFDREPLAQAMELAQGEEGTDQVAAIRGLLREHPQNFFLNFELGKSLFRNESFDEAVPFLEKAAALLPAFAKEGSPYDLLVQYYEEQGDQEKLTRTLMDWWRASPLKSENGIKLADLLSDQDRVEEAVRTLEEVMYVDPLSDEPHRMLGELYLMQQKSDLAVREFQVLLDLNPADQAQSRYLLARALFESGDRDRAKNEVILALEIAPGLEEAQRLLLELVSP